ncbi:MAG: coiled-coil protein [Thermoplasmataceae archaeon]
MSDLLEEFEQKRELLRRMVEEHIKKRDELAAESHKYAEERDTLNGMVRELREEVKKKITRKGELIEEVQKLRSEKEEHYKVLADLRKEYRKIKDETNAEGFDKRTLKAKEKELQRLETKQQTTLLDKKEEDKVVAEIRKLTNEIKNMKASIDKALQTNDSIKEITAKINTERKAGEDLKKRIDEISNEITALSDEINRGLQELDDMRKKADENHEQFVKFSQESTKEHEAFIQTKNELRDLEKVINTLKTKDRATKKKEKEGELQKKASSLFEKFKNGEQLTTEDLLILQKAGFL